MRARWPAAEHHLSSLQPWFILSVCTLLAFSLRDEESLFLRKTDSHLWEAVTWLMTLKSYWTFGERCSLQICLRSPSMSVFVCEGEEVWWRPNLWPETIRRLSGDKGWQWWRIDVPLKRLREDRLWKPPVSWWYVYALSTGGCGVCQVCVKRTGGCDIAQNNVSGRFLQITALHTIDFTRRLLYCHSHTRQDFTELGLRDKSSSLKEIQFLDGALSDAYFLVWLSWCCPVELQLNCVSYRRCFLRMCLCWTSTFAAGVVDKWLKSKWTRWPHCRRPWPMKLSIRSCKCCEPVALYHPSQSCVP